MDPNDIMVVILCFCGLIWMVVGAIRSRKREKRSEQRSDDVILWNAFCHKVTELAMNPRAFEAEAGELLKVLKYLDLYLKEHDFLHGQSKLPPLAPLIENRLPKT